MLTEGVALTFWLISAFSGRDLDFLTRSKEQQGKKMLKVGAHECVCVCVFVLGHHRVIWMIWQKNDIIQIQMKRKRFVILFDVLILAERGISVNDLQVAKQLVYSFQVNLSLSNIYVSCIFGSCVIFPHWISNNTYKSFKGELEELGYGTIQKPKVGFHANEGSFIFSSTSAVGRIRSKGK